MLPIKLAVVSLFAVACTTTLPPVDSQEGRTLTPASHVGLTTADGEVIGVDRNQPSHQLSQGLTLELRADADEPLVVRLAPGWYLDEQGVSYGPRERLSVRGRREVQNGRSVFVVQEVRSKGRWIPLRDASGQPLWQQRSPAP
jgi:hypothetical protein